MWSKCELAVQRVNDVVNLYNGAVDLCAKRARKEAEEVEEAKRRLKFNR